MKTKLFILTISSLFLFLSCEKGKQRVVPPCIHDKIELFSTTIACETGAKVDEYEFQGDYVYVFNGGHCLDGQDVILSNSCDTLGYLGGLVNEKNINGKDFYKKAKFIHTVYSN